MYSRQHSVSTLVYLFFGQYMVSSLYPSISHSVRTSLCLFIFLYVHISIHLYVLVYHAQLADNRAVRYKLNHVPSRFLYHSDFVTSRRLLYHPDMCNCTMPPYIPCTIPACAVHTSCCTGVCRTGPCLDSSSCRF